MPTYLITTSSGRTIEVESHSPPQIELKETIYELVYKSSQEHGVYSKLGLGVLEDVINVLRAEVQASPMAKGTWHIYMKDAE